MIVLPKPFLDGVDFLFANYGGTVQPKQVTQRAWVVKYFVAPFIFDLDKEVAFKQRLFNDLYTIAPLALYFM